MLMTLVSININTTLGVYLSDGDSIAKARYGLLISLNAAMVVLFQIPLRWRIEGLPPMLMMALGRFV